METIKQQKFNTVDNCLSNSGLEQSIGTQALFFKPDGDENDDETSSHHSYFQTAKTDCATLFDEDFAKCFVIDFNQQSYSEVLLKDILDEQKQKKTTNDYTTRTEQKAMERCIIAGELTTDAAYQLLNVVSESHSRYNGLIIWELKMIQNYDKVMKFDNDVVYYNIEAHNHCSHINHVFWIKMVKFGRSCVIFINKDKCQQEVANVIFRNFDLTEVKNKNTQKNVNVSIIEESIGESDNYDDDTHSHGDSAGGSHTHGDDEGAVQQNSIGQVNDDLYGDQYSENKGVNNKIHHNNDLYGSESDRKAINNDLYGSEYSKEGGENDARRGSEGHRAAKVNNDLYGSSDDQEEQHQDNIAQTPNTIEEFCGSQDVAENTGKPIDLHQAQRHSLISPRLDTEDYQTFNAQQDQSIKLLQEYQHNSFQVNHEESPAPGQNVEHSEENDNAKSMHNPNAHIQDSQQNQLSIKRFDEQPPSQAINSRQMVEELDEIHYNQVNQIQVKNDYETNCKEYKQKLDHFDIIFSIMNHSLLQMIPSTNLLIDESKIIKKQILGHSVVDRQLYIAQIFDVQDKITHFHYDLEKKRAFLMSLEEIYKEKKDDLDQLILVQHLLGRIQHLDNAIEEALIRLDQAHLYFGIENKQEELWQILGLIFMPPTLVSGLMGMNCNVPWQTTGDADVVPDHVKAQGFWARFLWCLNHNGPFFGITAGALMISAIGYCYFRSKNIISQRKYFDKNN